MPYKDAEKRKEAARRGQAKYRAKNREKINAAARQRRKDDPEWAERQRAKCRRWLKENPEHRRAYKSEWARKNPESVLATKRKGKYGVSKEEQEQMFSKQGGRCMICSEPISFIGAHLDHCHKSNKVRGFLCRCCNHILGNANDSPELLEKAAAYLRACKNDKL